uniref:zinc finger BED domain-containing protein n=1 Tax=Scatophagus argus TaxID=75038 RepID=UPI001ED7ED8E|nr:zinc finger BED domain-containing protein [Scatophagus argus]
MVRKRSIVWGFFKNVDTESVQCLLCSAYLVRQGPTTNMLRHLRVQHPTEFKKIKGRLPETTPINGDQDTDMDSEQFCSVEVTLENSDASTTEDGAVLNSAVNGTPADQMTHEEASDGRPAKSRRSLVWRHFERLDSLGAARCRICMQKLQCFEGGGTSNLRRHMSSRHPKVFSQLVSNRQNPPPSHSSQASDVNGDTLTPPETVGATEKSLFSVEVALEDRGSDSLTTGNDADLNSAANGFVEAAQEGPVRRRRSLIWRHFECLDSLTAARCRICMKKIQYFECSSTSNLRRHMSKRHPKVFAQLVANGQNPPPSHSSQASDVNGDTLTPPETVGATEKSLFSVEVALEDRGSDSLTTGNDADLHSAANGIMEAAQKGPVRERRSLIWRHFECLDSLAAARCRICMKKMQYVKGSSTSNLRRHMSKRHPKVFSQLVANGLSLPPSHSSQASDVNGDTLTPPETFGATEKSLFSGASKVSRAYEGQKHLLRREQELIESLRRAQREEARALDHQRELLERLRAANAREAAAEREQIQSLRKAQLDEAKDLIRQKEELQEEKAELQKRWEELEQEREEFFLFSRGQQAS